MDFTIWGWYRIGFLYFEMFSRFYGFSCPLLRVSLIVIHLKFHHSLLCDRIIRKLLFHRILCLHECYRFDRIIYKMYDDMTKPIIQCIFALVNLWILCLHECYRFDRIIYKMYDDMTKPIIQCIFALVNLWIYNFISVIFFSLKYLYYTVSRKKWGAHYFSQETV